MPRRIGGFQSTPSGGKATGALCADDRFNHPFQSTPSGGKATVASYREFVSRAFQSTPSGGKATRRLRFYPAHCAGFNPRLPGGRRPVTRVSNSTIRCFNPRLPGGRRLGSQSGCASPRGCFNPRLPGGRRQTASAYGLVRTAFQSTPSGGKATRALTLRVRFSGVSIHAFRGEGDRSPAAGREGRTVSIHAFRGEGDRPCIAGCTAGTVSIHAFRGEGDQPLTALVCKRGVSIHAFRGEGDAVFDRVIFCFTVVSIHAFRGEGDPHRQHQLVRRGGFNPRLPGGRRPVYHARAGLSSPFQSTPSGGKATRRRSGCRKPRLCFNPRLPGGRRRNNTFVGQSADSFNPRLPGGRRPTSRVRLRIYNSFNPRLPGGRRRDGRLLYRGCLTVSIHAFRGEGDQSSITPKYDIAAFQSTPSGGKATGRLLYRGCLAEFQSTPSGGKATARKLRGRALDSVSIHAFRGEGDWFSRR